MFAVKAVRASGEYTIFQSEHVEVVPPGSGPEGLGLHVLTFDDQDSPPKEVLCVSNDPDEFTAIYIMNDRGKTVDAVHAEPPQPPKVPSQLS